MLELGFSFFFCCGRADLVLVRIGDIPRGCRERVGRGEGVISGRNRYSRLLRPGLATRGCDAFDSRGGRVEDKCGDFAIGRGGVF